jgi:CBS domain-containing protein
MTIGRMCVREVHTAREEESVRDAAQRMRDRGVGTLIVVDGESRPLGILTDRDLVTRVLAAARDPAGTRVSEVMTQDPRVVYEETPIEDALRLMRQRAVRRLPVVDREARLTGLISSDDLLEFLTSEIADVGRIVAAQISGPPEPPEPLD